MTTERVETPMQNTQQQRQPTAEEKFRVLFERVAKLSDRVSELEHPVKISRLDANRALVSFEHVRDVPDAMVRQAQATIDRVHALQARVTLLEGLLERAHTVLRRIHFHTITVGSDYGMPRIAADAIGMADRIDAALSRSDISGPEDGVGA